MNNLFTLALSGLSEPDAKTVLQALDSPDLGQWNLAEGGDSDLLIIDVDSVWGHMDWLRAVSDGRRCAAYTEQESMRDADLLLHKPLDSQALTAMLRGLQPGSHASDDAPAPPSPAPPAPAPAPAARPPQASAAPAVQPPDPPPASRPAPPVAARPPDAPAAAAEPDRDMPSTVGAMLLSGGIEAPVMLREGDGGMCLFIDPVHNVYRAPPQLKPLEKLLSLPSDRMKPVDAQDPEVQHAGPEQPIVRLLWFAALTSSDGTLSPHLDAAASWKLTRWPQIEREFPRHFRIATAMMKQAGTLEEVATAAKSPVEDVAGFINAYYLAGYVAAVGSDEPGEAANSTASVLSRLRRSLSRPASS